MFVLVLRAWVGVRFDIRFSGCEFRGKWGFSYS